MDGVLFDTEAVCKKSWCLVADELSIPDMEKVFTRIIGTNAHDTEEIFTDFYGGRVDYKSFRARADVLFRQLLEENGVPLKPGVRELLEYLKGCGARLALASSTGRETVEAHLESTGLRGYFSVLVTGDMIVHSKPEPEIYLLACDKLHTSPGEAYAIEDSYNGIRAAFRAGLRPIMVPDMLPPTQEMEEKSCRIFTDLFEVMEYFRKFEPLHMA